MYPFCACSRMAFLDLLNITAGPSNRFVSPGSHHKLTAHLLLQVLQRQLHSSVRDQAELRSKLKSTAKSHTSVSLEPLKGTCLPPLSSARMHSFSASRLLLIGAPSRRVCRSLSYVSTARGGQSRAMAGAQC